jgi:hypothetical protein
MSHPVMFFHARLFFVAFEIACPILILMTTAFRLSAVVYLIYLRRFFMYEGHLLDLQPEDAAW